MVDRKDLGVEVRVDAEEAQCMFMSREQIAEQNHNFKRGKVESLNI